MEDEGEGGGLMQKLLNKKSKEGEVDYRTKSGTAWSHSFLNQKPWHPLSYPNQRRKWIAEQTNAQRARRAEEVAREFAQEQQIYRQTAELNQKEKEKVETMKAVSFMYVRPPGYNPESAKAAEIEDERKRLGITIEESSTSAPAADEEEEAVPVEEDQKKKKKRPRDVFGRALPTEEEFSVLKNAPRLETGLPARAKPFGVEVRNVKCARCGTFGHQSGDRECSMKDMITPSEESRLKRDDPLTAILAQTDSSEVSDITEKVVPGISFWVEKANNQKLGESGTQPSRHSHSHSVIGTQPSNAAIATQPSRHSHRAQPLPHSHRHTAKNSETKFCEAKC
ncbi:hypothetical protein MKW94_018012 [Papaver nudicaule]|uniref:CBF1-interacting co-repressor CIR N-terminal domain-containing protein n=1 Tax=Papaver nudicaule TaxID=74823 RepID=A0AA41SKE3_PAPNU|nr:hypothetical protein [Papaver nudicaule]